MATRINYKVKKDIFFNILRGEILQGSQDGLWLVDDFFRMEAKISENAKHDLIARGYLEPIEEMDKNDP